ncbi:MAG: hypothetical protein IJS15_15590, partial [Victivallales bacterium]|nr:hypothetical protein [Victivallales bacterium]
ELLVWCAPLVKRRGHFVIFKEIEGTLALYDPLLGESIPCNENFPYETKAKFLRIKGGAFQENLVSPSDVYGVTAMPMACAGDDACEAVIDVVITDFHVIKSP